MKQQKHKLIKRVLSVVLSLSMALCLIPSTVFAAEGEGNVAKIGNTEYATFAEAAAAVQDGQTIELLQDCESGLTGPWAVNKNITVTGNYTVTFDYYSFGIHGNNTLTLDGCKVVINNAGYTAYSDRVNNAAVMLDQGATLTLDNNASLVIDSPEGDGIATWDVVADNTVETLNVLNGSTYELKNSPGGGVEDYNTDSANVDVNVKDGSKIYVHDSYSGFIGTLDITVVNSIVDVLNSSGNGSNGSNFYISDNSIVTFSGNGSHGLSAADLTIETGSAVIANNNGYYGVYANGAFLVDSTSTMTVTHNSYKGDFAGLKLTSNVTDGKVEAGAVVTITDNYCSGLSNNGKCVFEEGSKLTITTNNNDKGTTSNGGGIYNSGASANLTLPSDAVIYNNHAKTAGDDIFNNTTSTITFGKVGNKWALDGDPDCEHLIDGWYDDSNGARWEAHADTEEGNHIVEFINFGENGLATVTSLTALKAAHGIDAQDKTSYPGMDKTVETTDSEGNKIWSDNETVAAGDTVNFKLESNVPDDLMNYIIPDVENPEVVENEVSTLANVPIEDRGEYSMTIHDQMDKAFVDMTAPVVTLDRAGDDNDVTLENTYYYTTATDDGCTFHIVIDLIALYENGIITDEDIASATPITVTYTATLKEDAAAGSYENTAWVTYPTGESEKPIVTVDTYGITIFKYDSANPETGLSGAVFEIYQKDESGAVITDSKVELTSGDDGYATLDGLDSGTYYIKETQAPNGYVCSDQELEINIPVQADTDKIVTVNFANTQIPHTGGMGTTLYTIGGAVIVAAAAVLFVISRKKRQSK